MNYKALAGGLGAGLGTSIGFAIFGREGYVFIGILAFFVVAGLSGFSRKNLFISIGIAVALSVPWYFLGKPLHEVLFGMGCFFAVNLGMFGLFCSRRKA